MKTFEQELKDVQPKLKKQIKKDCKDFKNGKGASYLLNRIHNFNMGMK